MKTTISSSRMASILKELKDTNKTYLQHFPGETGARQPVHTVYGGAQLFKRTTVKKIGQLAEATAKTYLKSAENLVEAFQINQPELADKILRRMREKLAREAVEDFRIDFEDGFGVRSEKEEDETAVFAAKELAVAWADGSMSPFSGIRVKSMGEETKGRSLRTLDLFLTALVKETGGALHPEFVVTLPKITSKEQIRSFVDALEILEKGLGLPNCTIPLEIMIETPQSIFSTNGKLAIPKFIKEARGRCRAAHFGTYDYTASLNVTANQQRMDHPACDFARHIMKVTLAGTGIRLSDGATNIMPVPIHKEPKNAQQETENRAAILKAWRLSYQHIVHSLQHGYYQGWDLHPAQLPVRYVALYNFFLEGLSDATKRLSHFVEHAAKATLVGDVFDDAATGQGLLNYFLRARSCGAVGDEDLAACGLTEQELATRSFMKIIKGRQK